MPLYLIPLSKTENGSTVMPWQSMGGKAFDPGDLESMEHLQGLYEHARARIRPPRRTLLTPVFGLFGIRYPAENPTVTDFRERWERPFEDIVAEATAAPSDFMIREYDPQILENTEYLSKLEDDFPWFPFYALYDYDGPDGEPMTNHVVVQDTDSADAFLGYTDAEDAFLDFEGQEPKQPDEMRRIADIFDKAAANYEPEEDEEYHEPSVFTARAAAEWLRLWADRGHPCEAQRLLWSGQGWYRIHVG